MRKLPSQLLRIALALHIIECYHEPNRPRHELQIETLNRAVEFCRYYRSTFEVVQQSATDSDAISSVLLKVWDMAATSPAGLAVRDAYRSIKALSRRAKELGRNVSAYTIDLYYQLEKMGKGRVHREGRTVRFVVGETNPPTEPPGFDGTPNPPSSPNNGDGSPISPSSPSERTLLPPSSPLGNNEPLVTSSSGKAIEGVTVLTVDETTVAQGLDVSFLSIVSPVPKLDVGQVELSTSGITAVLD